MHRTLFLFFKKGVRGIELKKKLANKFYIWQKLPNINSLKSTFWSRLKNSFAIRHTKQFFFFFPLLQIEKQVLKKNEKGKKPWNQEDDEETLLSIRRTNLRIIIEILILYALVYINANQLILWDIVLTVCRPQRNDFDNTNTIKNKLPDKIKERHVGSKAYISS